MNKDETRRWINHQLRLDFSMTRNFQSNMRLLLHSFATTEKYWNYNSDIKMIISKPRALNWYITWLLNVKAPLICLGVISATYTGTYTIFNSRKLEYLMVRARDSFHCLDKFSFLLSQRSFFYHIANETNSNSNKKSS